MSKPVVSARIKTDYGGEPMCIHSVLNSGNQNRAGDKPSCLSRLVLGEVEGKHFIEQVSTSLHIAQHLLTIAKDTKLDGPALKAIAQKMVTTYQPPA